MYQEHPVFTPPPNTDQQIWRYMDVARFVALLSKRSLYFVRADRLGDPFEGSVSRPTVEARQMDQLVSRTVTASDGKVETWLDNQARWTQHVRRLSHVSCWHMNECESAAMWAQYAAMGLGVAIQSTFARLCRAVARCAQPIYIGVVRYIDYNTEFIPVGNTFYPLLHKRQSFAHERELRAIVNATLVGEGAEAIWAEPKELGVDVPLDLEQLVQGVFVDPTAAPWFKEVVETLAAKYELRVPVEQSSLAEGPLF